MNRILLVLSFCAAASAWAQPQDLSKVELKVTQVAGHVWMLEGAGGNIAVSSGPDGLVIVDDQFAPLAPKIKAALKGLSDKPLRFVLNTHFHGDHTGSNSIFSADAPIVAHDNVYKRLFEETKPGPDPKRPPTPVSALPVLTFNDSVVLHLNGEDIRAVHLPAGHTDGDSVIWFSGSKVLHMGDDFFSGRFPFVDLASGGSIKGLIANVEQVLREVPGDYKIIPGHGPISTSAELKDFLKMLKDTRAAVEKGVKAKKSVEQLKKDKVLAAWGKWSWEFIDADKFTELLYQDVTGKSVPAPAPPK